MPGIQKRLALLAQTQPAWQVAFRDGTGELLYSELAGKVNDCAQWLASLDARVVALHGQNSIDWVLIDLACQEAGVVCVPLPTFFSVDQIKRCLRQVGADIVISDQQRFDSVMGEDVGWRRLGNRSSFHVWKIPVAGAALFPQGTQKITFTSGSTGSPKGVCLSEAHQWLVARSLADAIGIESPRHLCLLPLSTLLENVAGIYSPLLCGGCIVLADDDARGISGSSGLCVETLLACISQVQPTTMILLPQLLSVLVAACKQGWQPPASLEFIAVGGGKVAADSITVAHQIGLPVYQGYGLSECGSVVALNTPGDQQVDSVGRVLPHCNVAIKHSEIVVSGANHLGYLGDSDSWYPDEIPTGDIGAVADGCLSIDGRKKNILISSFGRNVSPEWVEAELLSIPLLSQCMVVGDGEPYLSALVCAPPGVGDAAIARWIERVNKNLPDYARVLRWQRVAEPALNKHATANGRLQRDRVARAFSKDIERCYAADSALKQLEEMQ